MLATSQVAGFNTRLSNFGFLLLKSTLLFKTFEACSNFGDILVAHAVASDVHLLVMKCMIGKSAVQHAVGIWHWSRSLILYHLKMREAIDY